MSLRDKYLHDITNTAILADRDNWGYHDIKCPHVNLLER